MTNKTYSPSCMLSDYLNLMGCALSDSDKARTHQVRMAALYRNQGPFSRTAVCVSPFVCFSAYFSVFLLLNASLESEYNTNISDN